MAATARASSQSNSDQWGALEVGFAASFARVSVILRKALWTVLSGGVEMLIAFPLCNESECVNGGRRFNRVWRFGAFKACGPLKGMRGFCTPIP